VTRRLVRTLIGGCCRASGVLSTAERRNRRRLTILCYHRVLPADRKAAYFCPDLVVTPESFRLHCRTLARYFTILPLSEAVDMWRKWSEPQRPIAVVTFDDGYRDNYENAAPVLDETGLRATFFVIAGLVDTTTSTWYDRLAWSLGSLRRQGRLKEMLGQPAMAELLGCSLDDRADLDGIRRRLIVTAKALDVEKRRALLEQLETAAGPRQADASEDSIMTWRQLAELADAGHEIGSHSQTHEILTQLNDASLESEVTGSRELLEKRLGRCVRAFCYPNGNADERVTHAVDTAGYACAVTVTPGSNEPTQNLLGLKRWFIHEDRLCGPLGKASATLLRMELCGLADRVFCRRQVQAEIGSMPV